VAEAPGGLDLARLAWSWSFRPDVVVVLVALGSLYVRGWSRLRRRGHTVLASRWRVAAYLAGLGLVALALLSPLHPLAEMLFTAHMIQHQLLLMAAPILLLLGNPYPFVLWGCSRGARARLASSLATGGRVRRVWRWLTWMPIAGGVYAVTLVGWHYPPFYEAALRHPFLHDTEHVTFFGAAVLFWWPVLNPAPRLHRLTTAAQYGYRIGYLILATALNTLLGAVLGMAERAFYPAYAAAPRIVQDWSAVDDQAFGGGVMWSGSHMYLIAILILIAHLVRSEERGAPLADEVAGENEDARPSSIV
jgi:cytochrome c oxidase assembly factor CtaG